MRVCIWITNWTPEVYMSLPFVYPWLCAPPPLRFNTRPVAKSRLSINEATVSTPPTIAHVLEKTESLVSSGALNMIKARTKSRSVRMIVATQRGR